MEYDQKKFESIDALISLYLKVAEESKDGALAKRQKFFEQAAGINKDLLEVYYYVLDRMYTEATYIGYRDGYDNGYFEAENHFHDVYVD